MPADLEITFDPGQFARVMKSIRGFDKSLNTAVRKRLREAAQPVVQDVKNKLQAGGASRTGLRAGLAAGTKLSIRTGRLGGISIVTTGAKLPAGKQPMVRAYNKSTFRHPVMGNRDVWVTQAGRPYFGTVIYPHRPEMQDAMLQALKDAVAEMEREAR